MNGVSRLYIIVCLFVGLLSLAGCGKSTVIDQYAIVPMPVELNTNDEVFILSPSTACYVENIGQNDPSVKYMLRQLRSWHFKPSLVGKAENNCIHFIINDEYDAVLGDEGYILTVGREGVHFVANSEHGLFYAFQTFAQMLPEDINQVQYRSIALKGCRIVDYPKYEWRGSMLDVSRHFFSITQLKKHLDLMAAYKLNKFHWHLTDDQGWRVESKKYLLLNDISSWRVPDNSLSDDKNDTLLKERQRTYGGYYTQDEIADLVAYAAERYIDILPEINFPGHCCALLEAYPQFACVGSDTLRFGMRDVDDNQSNAVLCLGNDSVMLFVKDVLDEILPLFPFEYIHIGGNDVNKDAWEQCPRCNAKAKQLGYSSAGQLYGWMLSEIESYVRRQQKYVIGWDEIATSLRSKEIAVMAQHSSQRASQVARRGNQVIMTPENFCSFERPQADSVLSSQWLPIHKVYQFNPTPRGLSSIQQRNIKGAQSVLWTSNLSTLEQVEHMTLPRLCALAEVLWSPSELRSWDDFRGRMEKQIVRLQSLDFSVGMGSFVPWITVTSDGQSKSVVSFHWEVGGTHIYWRLNSDKSYSLYTQPLSLSDGDTIHTISFWQGRIRGQECEFVIK